MEQRQPQGREVINVFRIFIGIRLLVAAVSALAIALRQGPRLRLFETSAMAALAESALLLAYLSIPWLQRRLKGGYLPIGLAAATLGPVTENLLLLGSFFQVDAFAPAVPPPAAVEMSRQVLLAGQFQLSILLLVPLILVSWLYPFRITLGYVLATALIDGAIPLIISGGSYYSLFRFLGEIGLRTMIFVFLGYLIHRLVTEQKRQNAELAAANRQLASYATTLEQLAVSHERNRLAREFHDTLAHTLSAVAVQLEAVRALQPKDPGRAGALLDQSLTMTRNGLNETRRAIQALRAAPLDDLGLRTALEQLARASAERYGWELSLRLPDEINGLSMEAEHAVYRIAEEALRNAGQHASAGRVQITAEQPAPGRLQFELQDDGVGFEYDSAEAEGRFGLRGMRERAESIGARLEIETRPGGGARLRLAVGGGGAA